MFNKKLYTLAAFLVIAATILSACGAKATATPKPASTEVEVFSWWVGPGEADGLAAMVIVFNQQYPNIQFINAAVAGGAGTNAKAVLATRLAAGDPPDSWQAHAGQETIANYVAAGQVKPLDDLFASTGFSAVLPQTLLPLISKDGHPYSVPVNIHRSNVLWYNPKVLAAAGITANPKTDFKTLGDFFAVCDQIKAAGKICLSLGAPWTAVHLFENIMIGTMGADKWNGLWATPPTTDWNGPDVANGIANFAKALTYTNADASTLPDWQTPSKMLADGDAAFNIMGDWADGYFSGTVEGGNLALTPGTDYGWAPVPGTKGIFQFLSDSFTLPKGAPHPDNAKAWLTVAGSREGQEAFNPVKGSICARTDCDPSLFNAYLKTAITDWSKDTIVGSLTHGVVAADPFKAKINDAVGFFLNDRDGAAFQKALVDGYAAEGPK